MDASIINVRVSLILACFTFIVWSVSESSSTSEYTIVEVNTKRSWSDAVAECAKVTGRHIAMLDSNGENELLRQAATSVEATVGYYWMTSAGHGDCDTMNLNNEKWKLSSCTKPSFYICEKEVTSPSSPTTTAVLPTTPIPTAGFITIHSTSTTPQDTSPNVVTSTGLPHVEATSAQNLSMCSNLSSVCYRGYRSIHTSSSGSSNHKKRSSDFSLVTADDNITYDRFVLKKIKGCRSRLRCAAACIKESSCTWFVYSINNDCLLYEEAVVVN